ncbi:alpha/beta hydrolase [Streptomyces eurocidicus]|uniref:Alpha/beta hydrolase n=1 Tax=Streptomyces eurocidicus TaxID=66423 RepID=A0A2N8NUG1_STREU|nr:alpha/beta fold hydrolase [Streptomyces eurocidicus]MBB5120260.1 pimeloyl-ACP methyl ester carboxylesterase [Streptomyces eurocidicus]MBF6056060.1 alpha/beta fold hydrolase [Streptomyces eurocidicus]PNE32406.1 alpha/beta hydrolase [Streptomyces eurocidicus]
MDTVESGTVAVPGAKLYFEVRGTGPLLLLIPGGASDAEVFRDLAYELAVCHRVVTYDPRGISRSLLGGPPPEPWLDTQVDDAFRLLDSLTRPGEPVRVFGSCAGALTALELLVRDARRIRLAIAHEPPAMGLLPDAPRHAAFFEEVYATFRRDGVPVALEKLRTIFSGRPAPPLPEATDNSEFFLSQVMLPSSRCVPDVTALAAVADRIVLAGGRASRTHDVHRPVTVLAQRLGREPAEFPGGHAGYATHPALFAAHLAAVLAGAQPVLG